jgi:hypothetical protein
LEEVSEEDTKVPLMKSTLTSKPERVLGRTFSAKSKEEEEDDGEEEEDVFRRR